MITIMIEGKYREGMLTRAEADKILSDMILPKESRVFPSWRDDLRVVRCLANGRDRARPSNIIIKISNAKTL